MSQGLCAEDMSTEKLDEVLIAETRGTIDRRQALEPVRSESDSPPAVWWQSGYVRSGSSWSTYEDFVHATCSRENQSEYERLQARELRGAKRHVLLAKWCLRNDRPDQFRAHMITAAKLDPSLLTERHLEQMGFARVGDRWLSPEEAYDVVKERSFIEQSLAKWSKTLEEIRTGLCGSRSDVSRAEVRLAAIHSPDAVLAIDAELGQANAECQRHAVQAFSRIHSARSTLALAKYAAFSPAVTVRTAAIEALTDRRPEHFVPALLDLLATDARIESARSQLSLRMGHFAFRVKIVKETQRERHVRNLESVSPVRTSWVVGRPSDNVAIDFERGEVTGFGRNKIDLLKLHHQSRALDAVSEAMAANNATRAMNNRVVPILEAVSQEKSSDPNYWWNWWSRYTDDGGPTKVEVFEEVQRREMVDLGETFMATHSCFVAGTPVLTDTGPRPIDGLQIGDRVLSQDVDTGELRFRIVQRTTVRPASKANFELQFGPEAVTCTSGHNFWKAGTGWTKARDLDVGDRIRTPSRTATITGVTRTAPAKTYNLVVEGFHTYFVGESALLVQDVLPLTPTDLILPGFDRPEAAQ